MLVQFDAVGSGQESQIEGPVEPRADRVDLDGMLGVRKRLCRRDLVHAREPVDDIFRVAGRDSQADVFDLVAVWAKRRQMIEPLNALVVVVLPDLVALNWVLVATAIADLAAVSGSLEDGSLKCIPGRRIDVRPDVAVPARGGHQFDSQFHSNGGSRNGAGCCVLFVIDLTSFNYNRVT